MVSSWQVGLSLVLVIIVLNSLIAIMGDTYDKVHAHPTHPVATLTPHLPTLPTPWHYHPHPHPHVRR